MGTDEKAVGPVCHINDGKCEEIGEPVDISSTEQADKGTGRVIYANEKYVCIEIVNGEPKDTDATADFINRVRDRVALELGISRSQLEGSTLSVEQCIKAMNIQLKCIYCKSFLVMKPFIHELYSEENSRDVAAVLDARIRPKRKLKLLMAMGISRNMARKMLKGGGNR